MARSKTNSIDIVITGNVAWNDELSWLERLLYGVIRGLTRNDYYCCYASNEYFAELLKRDESIIRRALATLEGIGVIYRSKGWVLLDNGKMDYQRRMIVLTEHKAKFESEQEKMLDLREKSSKKNAVQVGKNARLLIGKNAHHNKSIYPYEKDIINNNIKKEITPVPPYKGALQGDVIQHGENLVFGKYGNVRLTASEYGELCREFGEELTCSLIERLDARIQSGVKGFRARGKKQIIHSAIVREWALAHGDRLRVVNKKALVGGIETERRTYTDEQMAQLFTPLSDDDASGAQ